MYIILILSVKHNMICTFNFNHMHYLNFFSFRFWKFSSLSYLQEVSYFSTTKNDNFTNYGNICHSVDHIRLSGAKVHQQERANGLQKVCENGDCGDICGGSVSLYLDVPCWKNVSRESDQNCGQKDDNWPSCLRSSGHIYILLQ